MTTRTILCREGWYYSTILLGLFFGALVREVNLMLLLAALLCGPLVFSWRMAVLSLRQLRVSRMIPTIVAANEPWVVQIDVENPRPRLPGWAVVVEQTIQPKDEQPDSEKNWRPAVYFPFIAADSHLKKTFEGRLPQRGRYVVGPPILSTRFPFGLFRREIVDGEPQDLLVYPHIGQLTPGWNTRQHDAMDSSGRRQRHSRGSGDLYGVRKWNSGDSRRWIHWRNSAKHDKLMVRQFEQPQNRDAAVLLDLWQPDSPSVEQQDHVELAVSFTATVIREISRRGGCNLIVGTSNGKPMLEVGPVSIPMVDQVMANLAEIQASADDHLPELFRMALEHLDRGAEVIMVSTRPIDLDDADRFASLWNNKSQRLNLSQLRMVDVSDPKLSELFTP